MVEQDKPLSHQSRTTSTSVRTEQTYRRRLCRMIRSISAPGLTTHDAIQDHQGFPDLRTLTSRTPSSSRKGPSTEQLVPVGLGLLLIDDGYQPPRRTMSAPERRFRRYPDSLSASAICRRPKGVYLTRPRYQSAKFFRLASIVQDVARYLRDADPTMSQNRIFRFTAPLVIFLYVLAGGVVMPRYFGRAENPSPSPRYPGLPAEFLKQMGSSASNANFPFDSLSETSPMTAIVVLFGGLIATLLTLRLLVWALAALTVGLCDLDLEETRAFWKGGGLLAVDIAGKAGKEADLGAKDMVLGGILS